MRKEPYDPENVPTLEQVVSMTPVERKAFLDKLQADQAEARASADWLRGRIAKLEAALAALRPGEDAAAASITELLPLLTPEERALFATP